MLNNSDVDEQKAFSAAYHSVIALLARREHSVLELTLKLSKRYGTDDRWIEPAIEKAIANGYQSDARFAHAYARSRTDKGFGCERIANELQQKGVDGQLITQALAEVKEQGAEQGAITRTWQKKFKQPPMDFNEKMKQIRFLHYRGFAQAEIERLFASLEES